jgi:hypothetical protein
MHNKPALSAWCARGSLSCTSPPCQQQRKLAPLTMRVHELLQRQQQAVPARSSCHSARAHLQGVPCRQHTLRRPKHTSHHTYTACSQQRAPARQSHTYSMPVPAPGLHARTRRSSCRRHRSSPPQRATGGGVGIPHPSPRCSKTSCLAVCCHAARSTMQEATTTASPQPLQPLSQPPPYAQQLMGMSVLSSS